MSRPQASSSTGFKMAAQLVAKIALRGPEGVFMVDGSSPFSECRDFERDVSPRCRVMTFSRDGSLFAWCNASCITIVNTLNGQVVQKIPRAKTNQLSFSPLGTYLSTWEPYAVTKENPAGIKNLEVWEVKTGNLVTSFCQKKLETWEPRWTDDEKVCARSVTNEVHCFHDGNFSTTAAKLRLQGVRSFEISKGPAPYAIAAYVPGAKGAPAYVRLFRHPQFDSPGAVLANKSFFKADSVIIKWNDKGTAALVLAVTDVDKSGASYYGEQTLHYMNTNGESSMVQLAKRGPIYDVNWSPNSKEFCVVYGFMPAKATIFDIKCEPVFDFGTGPRNEVHYNPHGNIICICGFGNLQGWMEMWSRKDLKMIIKFQASDTTWFEWSPDGEHILTATTAPRLREGNGFKVWHYCGSLLYKRDVTELYQASWQPFPAGVFPEKPVSFKAAASTAVAQVPQPKAAYIPPHLRGTGRKPAKLHEIEPPQNQKNQEPISKSAAKNKKKREARARAKEAEQAANHQVQKVSEPPAVPASASSQPAVADDKKLRNLKKKLRQIEELKESQRAGKKLELNQLEKIKTEASLIKEIEALELGR